MQCQRCGYASAVTGVPCISCGCKTDELPDPQQNLAEAIEREREE